MCWKKMQYWLRGGLIGGVIAIIYDLISLIANNFQFINIWFLALILDVVVFFVIGAIIGIIIGLIINSVRGKKNRTNRNNKRIRRRKKK